LTATAHGTMNEDSGAVASIASFVNRTSLAEIDTGVRDSAARVIADTVGVIVAGTTGDLAGPLRSYVGQHVGRGDARILTWDLPVPSEVAAFANGTLGHALDFDDVVSVIPAHPSAIVVAALLAAEPGGSLSGAQLTEAYIVGVEVAAKVGQAIGLGHYNRGWHATGTIGIFGAIAALAKLLRLDESETRRAIGIGTSLASGLQCNFGTMTKPSHSGWAARSALVAVELARTGWTSNETALEGKGGFFDVYGTEQSSPASIALSLGNPYVFADPGVALKRYPCCYAVHRAVDGLRDLLGGPRTIGEIAEIRCSVPPTSLRPLLYPRPVTGLEGKFSMEYALAATTLDGSLDLQSFADPQVLRPEVAELYQRITVVEDKRCTVGDGTVRTVSAGTIGFVEVTVGFADGSSKTATVYKPKGSPVLPLDWADIRAKFLGCTSAAGVADASAAEVIDGLRHIEKVADLRALTRLLITADTATSRS
jgi:2-methylcitrate dehydratase PrpD